MSDLREAAQQALNYWESASFGDAVMVDKMDALRAALAQQAEPVEPVAWVKEDVCDGQYIDGRPRKIWWECNKGVGTAFYTTPPQRTMVPLTEEEIDKIFKHLCNTVGASCKTMARAVERAHGIKE